VREDCADDLGVLDRREQAHAAATARAGEHVEVEGAPHQVGPRPVAGFAGRVATEFGDLRRGGVGDGVRQRDPRALIGDGAAAPAGMGREDPVVEHEIDAGARHKGSELFEEIEGLEEEVTCAVGPLPLQFQQDASVAGELEAILGDGRPQQVAAELFESRALCRRHAQVRVEIDAFEVRLAGPSRADPRGIRLVPEAQDTRMLPHPRSG
jgi:hypothetical protein